MNEMLQRIEKSHAAQRQFVGDASHELHSPLATILSTLEVVDAHPHLLDHHLATKTRLPEATRMRCLVEDLMLLASADERVLTPRRDTVRLDDIVKAESARMRGERSVQTYPATGNPAIVGDLSALARVLRNLLDNAARHARAHIDITTRADDGNTVIVIGDDGPGGGAQVTGILPSA
jgi:signal transduction histidine kinase